MQVNDLRFVVVEDQGFQRWLAGNLLRELGAEFVLAAEDGNAALELLTAPDPPIDIVVCDLNMPGMDGMELIRHMGQMRHPASLIVVSGLEKSILGMVELMSREYGVNLLGAIEKPLTARKLKVLVERHRADMGATKDPRHAALSASDIGAALRDGQLETFYQPKVEMRTGNLKGAEALARWCHPELGLLQPGVFMAAVEADALIDPFTDFITREAARACRQWRNCGLEVDVSVNLSLASLFDVALADRLTGIVRAEGLDPRHVILEVTESSATRDVARKLENLSRLRMNGFGLSIDDFGTGYSSMERLSRVPFTELKIDQAFVKTAAARSSSRAIVEASLQLARRLGIPAVAEGVETHADWELMLGMGCEIAQGYYVGRPMARADMLEWAAMRKSASAD
ncbi:MAG TPA: EAL domain-containing response regulator [Usitatibacter sp.]|nr:EAL domain-containing response regulator [Usitatibacter sp.]